MDACYIAYLLCLTYTTICVIRYMVPIVTPEAEKWL